MNLAICPHTAVGTFVSRKFLNKNKVMITLATAHPSKFIDSVQSAIGKMIAQPIEMKQLYSKTERVIHAPNEVNFYKNYIKKRCIYLVSLLPQLATLHEPSRCE